MNLVTKEFIAAKSDLQGTLILSCFTGAARELVDAIQINPYSIEEFAEAIRIATEMPPEEKVRRMTNMRKMVSENNVYRWAGKGFAKIVARISGQLRDELSSVRGILIENKGLTLSLHYRLVSPDMLPAVMRVFRDSTRPYIKMKRITVNPGKKVLEVKPVINWDKGKAVLWILKKFGSTPRGRL